MKHAHDIQGTGYLECIVHKLCRSKSLSLTLEEQGSLSCADHNESHERESGKWSRDVGIEIAWVGECNREA